MAYPKNVDKVVVPPIKCQGIKTKLVPFILGNISWDGEGRWIEPFLGSGVVLFNAAPKRALVSDTNVHIVRFYQALQQGTITGSLVRDFLTSEGQKLESSNGEHYYTVRERFNREGSPLDFLFLSRSCFNGVMRFNKKGGFNVPFCKKPERFRQAYVTKIVNQVERVAAIIQANDWEFQCCDWKETLGQTRADDFVYLDPPYIGRHTDYFNNWTDQEAEDLATMTQALPCGFALSMWQSNEYRHNDHLGKCWADLCVRTFSHFYHVGSTEALRNEMEEALVIRPGFAANE